MGLMLSIVGAGFDISLTDESFGICMGKIWAF
jgi:hypothetical protein